MAPKRALVAVVLAQMITAVAVAQSDTPAADRSEFGRVSGGQIEVLTKQARKVSGSLGMTLSSGDFSGKGYEATLGGTVLRDRLWFFAAASVLPEMTRLSSTGAFDAGAFDARTGGFDARMDAQLGSRNNMSASFSEGRYGVGTLAGPFPASFLSLRYTGMASSNLLFNASFSRRSVTQPDGAFAPFGRTQ